MNHSQESRPILGDLRARVGSYRLLEPLGHGGMGAVYLAARRRRGRDELVVLKLLRDHIAQDDKYRLMFQREGAIATRLRHPNVVRTLEVGEHAGTHFMAMEFLDGQPFNALIRRLDPALPLHMRLSILCEMLKGLHYVHELREPDGTPLQLVHRDVSPSNVFVTYEGDVRLLDFGVAKLGTAQDTSVGEFRGRLSYAAPERLWGRPADRRSDVFAAGVMLWETIAGRSLATRIAPAFFEARLQGREPSLRDVVPDVEPQLAEICGRALQVDPDRRYQTAELFGRDLRLYLEQHGGVWERSAIGQELQQRFHETRRDMHRRIHDSLHKGTHSPSSMPAASPIALAAVQRSATRARPTPSFDPEPERHSCIVRRRRGWVRTVLCLVLCVVLTGLYFLSSPPRVGDVASLTRSDPMPSPRATVPHAPVERPQQTSLPEQACDLSDAPPPEEVNFSSMNEAGATSGAVQLVVEETLHRPRRRSHPRRNLSSR